MDQKSSFTKSFPSDPRIPKPVLIAGNGIIQTGNGIIQTGNGNISLNYRPWIKKLLLKKCFPFYLRIPKSIL